jgi:hypothetical protein
VRISLDGGAYWSTCANGGGSWTCSFSSGNEPLLSNLNALQVVAVE